MKKLILIFLLILGIGFGIYLVRHREVKDPNILELFGNIEIRQVDLGFRVEGKIAKIYVEEGDYVHKGQLLAALDDVRYKATYEQNLAEIELTKANSKNATEQYQRHIALCGDGTTSKQECDQLTNTKDSTKAELDAAVAAAKTSKKNYTDSKIYAPDEGIIMTRIQEPGASVTAGQSVFTMAKTKPVWVRAYIPETSLANIKYGMKADVYTDTIDPKTGEKRKYAGQVGYISPVAEFTPKTVQTEDLRTDLVYRVRIYIANLDEYLRQGMPVTVKFNLKNGQKQESKQ